VSQFLGIARERLYSPGKVEADRAILDAVATVLAQRHDVRIISAEDPLPEVQPGVLVFAMCQGPAALATLRRWEGAGVRVVNSPAAIENCHRQRMLPAFARAGVRHPASVLVATGDGVSLPVWIADGVWIKRGDVHATEPDDVVGVHGEAAARAALRRFHGRGIERALIQRHVRGDVIKFYAVRGTFFAWFPPADVALSLSTGEVAALRQLAEEGAAALGLEIFGGDCVRHGENDFWLIDLNDWPSYAACRGAAAGAISNYLAAQKAKPLA
jgi:hypothetical protein